MTDCGHALRANAQSRGEHQVQTEVGEIAPTHREVEALEQPSSKHPGDAQSAGHPPPHAGLDDADREPEPYLPIHVPKRQGMGEGGELGGRRQDEEREQRP